MIQSVMLRVFVWLGSKLFPGGVDVYAPDGEEGDIVAVTFSTDPLYLEAVADVEVYRVGGSR